MNTTNSDIKQKEFTIEDLKKVTDLIQKKEEKELPKGLGWFSKLMNKFGWHRKYEVLIIDKERLNIYNNFINRNLKI